MSKRYDAAGGRAQARNGTGLAAGIIGVLAVCFGLLFAPLGLVVGVVAVVLGLRARNLVQRGEATNAAAGLAGIVLGAIGTGIALVLLVGQLFL